MHSCYTGASYPSHRYVELPSTGTGNTRDALVNDRDARFRFSEMECTRDAERRDALEQELSPVVATWIRLDCSCGASSLGASYLEEPCPCPRASQFGGREVDAPEGKRHVSQLAEASGTGKICISESVQQQGVPWPSDVK